MIHIRYKHRSATSLVELLLFLGFFAVCSGIVISIIAFSNEHRVRQQVLTAVEQEGMQLTQVLTRRIRAAERILLPARSASGTALVLQMADETQNPTIIALQTGSIRVAEKNIVRTLSSEHLLIEEFEVRNTSASDNRQSLHLLFTAARIIPLPQQGMYRRTFTTLVTLFPDDELAGDDCGCASPTCTDGSLGWEVCEDEICIPAETTLPCE